MSLVIRENHEIKKGKDERKSSDLFFGLSGTGINTTKANSNEDSRIKEDLNLK